MQSLSDRVPLQRTQSHTVDIECMHAYECNMKVSHKALTGAADTAERCPKSFCILLLSGVYAGVILDKDCN